MLINYRVLLVDDEESILDPLRTIFGINGASCSIATSAYGGIQVINKGFQPHLIVTDLKMPLCVSSQRKDLGGLLFSLMARELCQVRVILYTSVNLQGIRREIPNIHDFIDGYIQKPSWAKSILQVAKMVLENKTSGEVLTINHLV